MATSGLIRERLIGNLLKGLGDLHSIFSLLGSDKMDSKASICWSKLGRAPTRGLLNTRAVLFVKSRDGRVMDSSNRGDLAITVARIQKREDVVVLSRGERLHG